MAVVWTTEADGTPTLTADTVQNLIDELEQNELAFQEAGKIVCGTIEIFPSEEQKRAFRKGFICGLKASQELA